jgi:hypothetical protein
MFWNNFVFIEGSAWIGGLLNTVTNEIGQTLHQRWELVGWPLTVKCASASSSWSSFFLWITTWSMHRKRSIDAPWWKQIPRISVETSKEIPFYRTYQKNVSKMYVGGLSPIAWSWATRILISIWPRCIDPADHSTFHRLPLLISSLLPEINSIVFKTLVRIQSF